MKECSLRWNNLLHHVRLKVNRCFRPVKKYDKLRPDYAMYTERLWKIEQVKKEIKKKQELQEWKDKLEVKKEVEVMTLKLTLLQKK